MCLLPVFFVVSDLRGGACRGHSSFGKGWVHFSLNLKTFQHYMECYSIHFFMFSEFICVLLLYLSLVCQEKKFCGLNSDRLAVPNS